MQTNFIKDLLDSNDVIIKNIKNFKDRIEIYLALPCSEQICPGYGSKTSSIHNKETFYFTLSLPIIPFQFSHKKMSFCSPFCYFI